MEPGFCGAIPKEECQHQVKPAVPHPRVLRCDFSERAPLWEQWGERQMCSPGHTSSSCWFLTAAHRVIFLGCHHPRAKRSFFSKMTQCCAPATLGMAKPGRIRNCPSHSGGSFSWCSGTAACPAPWDKLGGICKQVQ